jgi:hypothetical protein
MVMEERNSQVAVFFDYDNQKVDPRIIFDYSDNFGWVVKKRAYGDWVRDALYRPEMSSYSVELIDRPRFNLSDKQGNDITITVDAMEVVFTRPNINVFVFVTGDADFIPLVLKLKEYGKFVVIIASKNNTSLLLAKVCDRFIFYEHLVKSEEPPPLDHRDYYMLLARKAYGVIKNRGIKPTMDNMMATIKHFDPSFKFEKSDFKNAESLIRAIETTWSQTEIGVRPSAEGEFANGDEHKPQDGDYDAIKGDGHGESINIGVNFKQANFINFFIQLFEKHELADKAARLDRVKRLFDKSYPSIKFEKYDIKDFRHAIDLACESGKFFLAGNMFSYSKRYQIERGLKRMGIYINPSMKQSIVKNFIDVYSSFGDTNKRTLNFLAREVYHRNKNTFSKSSISNIFTALKFTGVFEGMDASSYITYSQPMRINCPISEIREKLDILYLKRIIKITNVRTEDLPLVSEYIFGANNRVEQITKMLDALIAMKEIVRENDEYIYKAE